MAGSFLDNVNPFDPAEEARNAGAALSSARRAVQTRIGAFLDLAETEEELAWRMQTPEVDRAISEEAGRHMGGMSDPMAKLARSIAREHLARIAASCPDCKKCHKGERCVCKDGCNCTCVKRKGSIEVTAEKETVHLESGDVEIEKGKLTRMVGGPPSEHMDKVRALADKGNKAALFFLNVLSGGHKGSIEASDADLAWAAGFIDGEGTFYLQQSRQEKKVGGGTKRYEYAYPRVTVGQSGSPALLHKMQSILGGKVNGPHSQPGNRQDSWQWWVNGLDDTLAVTAAVWPYLGEVKQAQAVRAISAAIMYREERGPTVRNEMGQWTRDADRLDPPEAASAAFPKTADARKCPRCGTSNADASSSPSGDSYVCSKCGHRYSGPKHSSFCIAARARRAAVGGGVDEPPESAAEHAQRHPQSLEEELEALTKSQGEAGSSEAPASERVSPYPEWMDVCPGCGAASCKNCGKPVEKPEVEDEPGFGSGGPPAATATQPRGIANCGKCNGGIAFDEDSISWGHSDGKARHAVVPPAGIRYHVTSKYPDAPNTSTHRHAFDTVEDAREGRESLKAAGLDILSVKPVLGQTAAAETCDDPWCPLWRGLDPTATR